MCYASAVNLKRCCAMLPANMTYNSVSIREIDMTCVTCWAEEQTIAAKMPHFCACLHRFDSSDLPLVTMKGHLLLIYTWKFWAELPRYFSLIYCSCECDFLEIQLEPTSIGVTELRGQRTEKKQMKFFPVVIQVSFEAFANIFESFHYLFALV